MQFHAKGKKGLRALLRSDLNWDSAVVEAAFGGKDIKVPLRKLNKAIEDGELDVRIAAALSPWANRNILEKAINDNNEAVRWATLSNPNISCRQIVRVVREFYGRSGYDIIRSNHTFSYFLYGNPIKEKRNFALKCVEKYSNGFRPMIS